MLLCSAREAARRLNRHEKTIRRMIHTGRLRATYVAWNRFGIEESEIVRLQKELGQATHQDLETRIAQLERQVAQITDHLGQAQGNTPLRSGATRRTTTPRRPPARPPDETLINEADLPKGARRASEFAEEHGIGPKTFRYHLLTGMGGEKVEHLAIGKPGRPGEIERWLSPDQQEAAMAFWQRHGIAVSGAIM